MNIRCKPRNVVEFEKHFDAEFGIGEGIADMDAHRKTWNAAIKYACWCVDRSWCCTRDLKSLLKTGSTSCGGS